MKCWDCIAFVAVGLLGWLPAVAQDSSVCSVETLQTPPRIAYHCPNGLEIVAESLDELADFILPAGGGNRVLDIGERAVLIEVQPGGGPFQVQTPYAIATVRGTRYVVDSRSDRTDVFVIEGVVSVTRPFQYEGVFLHVGEGVSVSPTLSPEVQTWAPERVAALLARFGR